MATKTKATTKRLCNVRDCEAPVSENYRGICEEHGKENHYLGCSVEGCLADLFCKGRCRAHYARWYRKKNGKAAPSQTEPVRAYGQERFEVFTRIPKEAAKVIIRASGREKGMYEKAAEILVEWAEQYAASAS